MAFHDNLVSMLEKYKELEKKLELGANKIGAEFANLSKEFSNMTPIVELIKVLFKLENDLKQNEEIIKDPDTPIDLKNMVMDDNVEVRNNIAKITDDLKISLLPKDIDDDKNVILEIRAGTGGDEAAIFAGDLFRMYNRYADIKKWKTEILSMNDSGKGGYKEIVASITGRGVFARLKFESGVHRVQRVPDTEANGRIHTSAATVAVLPEVEELDIKIEDKDLRIDVYRSSGAGGQHVNTTDSAVRITHIPTGTVVTQQDEKSQHKNKAKAMKILMARLYEAQKYEIESKRSKDRKDQIGSGDRSERIRTYNFPQGRVSDHRINLTLYKLDIFMEGDLDEMIESLVSADRALKLSESVF
jgi:peptide chain release factor 1